MTGSILGREPDSGGLVPATHAMKIAALTMAYNEPFFVPIWVAHYSRQVGARHCFLIDHGSDDGSTDGLAVNVLRLPRTALDENARARQVSAVAAELLGRYDAVVHADIDELVLADPRQHATLADYAPHAPAVTTAFGLELQHLPDHEPGYDTGRQPGAQRRWVRFAAAMCKPALVRRPVAWVPGFHSADAPVVLDQLFLIHLRYVDLGRGLARLARSRALLGADDGQNPHQRVPDAAFERMVRDVAALPRRIPERFGPNEPPLLPWVEALRASAAGRQAERYQFDLTLAGDELWELPSAFRAAL